MVRGLWLAVVFLSLFACTVNGAIEDNYNRCEDLHTQYRLCWNCSFDERGGDFLFATIVNTTGWVGFGLSPDGNMPGSDVVIGFLLPTDPIQIFFNVS